MCFLQLFLKCFTESVNKNELLVQVWYWISFLHARKYNFVRKKISMYELRKWPKIEGIVNEKPIRSPASIVVHSDSDLRIQFLAYYLVAKKCNLKPNFKRNEDRASMFLKWTDFTIFFFASENMKKTTSKVAHNQPQFLFSVLSTGPKPA